VHLIAAYNDAGDAVTAADDDDEDDLYKGVSLKAQMNPLI